MKKNKILCKILVMIMFSSILLVSCQTENKQISNSIATIWTDSSAVKIRKDYIPENKPGKIIKLNALKGEYESGQLLINAKRNISFFNFTLTSLNLTDSDKIISSENIEIFAQRYVDVTIPSDIKLDTGPYPDPIVPLDRYIKKGENRINKGETQGLWIRIKTSAETVAGLYTGEGVLTLNDEKINVPVELRVYNVEMPEEVHARTVFVTSYVRIGIREKVKPTQQTFEAYFNALADNRISVKYPHASNDYNDIVKDFVMLAQDNRITSYQLPYVSRTVGNKTVFDTALMTEIFKLMVEENIRLIEEDKIEIDLFKKAVAYLGSILDEPRATDYDTVKECDKLLTNIKKQTKELLVGYPNLQKSLMEIPNIVTTWINPQLIGSEAEGGVQTWVPLFDKFDSQAALNLVKERQATPESEREGGEHVWWYGCNVQKTPYPTYHIDDRLISSRVVSWMQYDYGIEGNLYWDATFYRYGIDPYYEPYSLTNGEGVLLYPGSIYGIDGPISSIRLESIREGMEEYEYLWLLEDLVQKLNKDKELSLNAKEIISKINSNLYEGIRAYDNIETFEKTKVMVLDLLENLNNNQEKAIEIINSILK